MIDIHSHLLPGVDDGSSDIDVSISQLQMLAEAGVRKVYLTPHYMQNIYVNSRAAILPVLTQLRQAVADADFEIDLEPGAEYFLDNSAAEVVSRENLCLGNSNYVLVETMMQEIPADFLENIYQLQKAGYRIILAHPERYSDVMRKPELVEELLHRDILMQSNAGSYLGFYGRNIEKTAHYLLERGYVHFIASDNHGDQPECFQKVISQMLREHYSEAIADLLLEENPAAISENRKINSFNHWRMPKPPRSLWESLKIFLTGHE